MLKKYFVKNPFFICLSITHIDLCVGRIKLYKCGAFVEACYDNFFNETIEYVITDEELADEETLPSGTPDRTLTNLIRQPSTITCCDRLDRTFSIDNTEPPIPTEQCL